MGVRLYLNNISTKLTAQLLSGGTSCVVSTGDGMLDDRLRLVKDLWAHNIRADVVYDEAMFASFEKLTRICRDNGINWLVILKRTALTLTVKIRNILRRSETEGNAADSECSLKPTAEHIIASGC